MKAFSRFSFFVNKEPKSSNSFFKLQITVFQILLFSIKAPLSTYFKKLFCSRLIAILKLLTLGCLHFRVAQLLVLSDLNNINLAWTNGEMNKK